VVADAVVAADADVAADAVITSDRVVAAMMARRRQVIIGSVSVRRRPCGSWLGWNGVDDE
jgi:hypothetical protein